MRRNASTIIAFAACSMLLSACSGPSTSANVQNTADPDVTYEWVMTPSNPPVVKGKHMVDVAMRFSGKMTSTVTVGTFVYEDLRGPIQRETVLPERQPWWNSANELLYVMRKNSSQIAVIWHGNSPETDSLPDRVVAVVAVPKNASVEPVIRPEQMNHR